MNIDERIAKIMEKMKLLVGKDAPEWKPPVTEKQVNNYEAEKGIKIPEDYRRFITTAASAGSKPFYGLYGLFEKKPSYEVKPVVEKRFQYTIKKGLKVYEMSEDEVGKFWEESDDREYDQGFFVLCTEGCGMDSILIVNTDDEETYGSVWFYDLANDFGIMPIYNPQTKKPMSFLDWLEYYVDKSLKLQEDEYFSYGDLV